MGQKLVLCIIDGFGVDHADPFNPIPKHMPWWNQLIERLSVGRIHDTTGISEMTTLQASGASVGLPEGQMGNSEVGHLTMGSGQIIEQDLVRLERSIQDQFLTHHAIQNLIHRQAKTHLIGLFSDGGVHSHKAHYMSIFHQLQSHLPLVCHLITDGRDTRPTIFLDQYDDILEPYVATVMGRYYAMDRDKRWDRTQKSIDAIVYGKGYVIEKNVAEYVKSQYSTDEFIEPGVNANYQGMQKNDAVIMVNFRPDRIIQLLSCLEEVESPVFTLSDLPGIFPYVTTLFPKASSFNTLGEWIAEQGFTQLRIAETEKYAHVTYFFNGGKDIALPLEDRIMIPSPRVSTYDEAPEMSADDVTGAVLQGIHKGYDAIIVNYANADMVGHTGKYDAVTKALAFLDHQLERVYHACLQEGYALIITSDHGQVENMMHPDMTPHTAHTTNPVPFAVLNSRIPVDLSSCKGLADIAGVVKQILAPN